LEKFIENVVQCRMINVYTAQGRGYCAKMIMARESSHRCRGPVGPQVRLTRQEYPRTRPRCARIV